MKKGVNSSQVPVAAVNQDAVETAIQTQIRAWGYTASTCQALYAEMSSKLKALEADGKTQADMPLVERLVLLFSGPAADIAMGQVMQYEGALATLRRQSSPIVMPGEVQ